jgi:hypothetical protein
LTLGAAGLLCCSAIPAAAQKPVALPEPDNRTVRFTVVHQHFGTNCRSYFYINPDMVWYEAVEPARYKDHSFQSPRMQITAYQWIAWASRRT